MATDNKKGEAAREALAKQAPGILDALLPKKLGDLLAGVTEKDMRGPEPMAETLKGTTGTPGAWVHSPAVFKLSALATRRLVQVARGAGLGDTKVTRVHARLIGGSNCVFRTDSTSHSGRIRPCGPGEIDHRFRTKSTTHSGGNRPRVPGEIDHRFRTKSTTHSGGNRPRVPDEIDHPFRSKSSWTCRRRRSAKRRKTPHEPQPPPGGGRRHRRLRPCPGVRSGGPDRAPRHA